LPLTPEEARKFASEVLYGDEEESSRGPDSAPVGGDELPERIGGLAIVSRIASGGMGTVYEARQEHPARTVAVKVLSRGLMSTKAQQRFSYEIDFLGRLQHPAIAQIYDAGTHGDGAGAVPYFVMEYVPGATTITHFADDRNLSIKQRVELFAKVCDGVQHGHQKGVIHRDLKPQNVLVDGSGQPKIIDFGVARATDSDIAVTTMRADYRELIGTLQYMSPEQCTGDPRQIDTRTDVYSLGVVLYELLCGKPPCDLSDTPLPHAARRIQDEEPVRPGAVRRALRGNLEAIVLKALDKSPNRRYETAQALADDLRRHVSGEPIRARKPGVWTRASQWIGRHPTLTTAIVSGIMIALTAATSLGGVWHLRSRPYRVALSDDGRRAVLVSRAGVELHTWTTPVGRGIIFADVVHDAPRGTLVLLGFMQSTDNPFPGALCAFSAADPGGPPIWLDRVAPEDLTTTFAGYDAAGFGVDRGRVLDLFPDAPGPEILVIYQHNPNSPAVLRVYDTGGRVLYQACHDGSINSIVWLEEARRLLCLAHNSEVYWPARGYDGLKAPHPRVIFALELVAGHKGDRLIGTAPDRDMSITAWYRCLLPPDVMEYFRKMELTESATSGGSVAQLNLQLAENEDAWLSWQIDAEGREVPGSRSTNDGYELSDSAPDPDAARLGDLPPIIAGPAGGDGGGG
jgi:serine/threonine protein kinase